MVQFVVTGIVRSTSPCLEYNQFPLTGLWKTLHYFLSPGRRALLLRLRILFTPVMHLYTKNNYFYGNICTDRKISPFFPRKFSKSWCTECNKLGNTSFCFYRWNFFDFKISKKKKKEKCFNRFKNHRNFHIFSIAFSSKQCFHKLNN